MEITADKNVEERHSQESQPNHREVQKFRSMLDSETCWKIKSLITATIFDPAIVSDSAAKMSHCAEADASDCEQEH